MPDRYVKLKKLWIEYATEFIGESNYLENNRTVISFNAWTEDPDYRRELATRLGLNFTDTGVDEVVGVGGGSSFDGRQLDGAGRSMALSERWQYFASDSFFTNLLCDEIVVELSKQIFGSVAGIDSWYRSNRGGTG